jgi:PIN domain nuclease of toxin-antitoxin system
LHPKLLLDTHIVIRYFSNHKKLSREQSRIIADAERRGECLGVCAFSLLEIVTLVEGRRQLGVGVKELFHEFDTNPLIRIIPLTTEVALEMAVMGDSLRDPADRVIVATARVHGLRLLTADQRIIDSRLVPVVE